MQLKNIKGQMSLAACALLQVTSPTVQAEDNEWDVDTAVLLYSEGDGRVSAFEPAIYAGRDLEDGDRIDLRLVVDALTGASPNGAHASSVAQTFTTPSGKGSYTTKAGDTPLDDTFRDTRVALGADWTMELDRLSKLTLGANFSKEFDYTSLGISASYAKDFNNRNTTLTTGFAFNSDTINPVGDIPSELMPMMREGFSQNREGDNDTKVITDFLVGITQVVDRKTIVQLNYSLGITDGYQNDPFKIVTVIDPVTGLPATGGIFDTGVTGNLPYVYEKRPDSRQKNNLYFKVVRHLEEDVINFSYRYYWDDWDINSHTFDFKYRYQMANSYLQPHFRYYMQSAAEFHIHNLELGSEVDQVTGEVLVDYASNDYRLAESETLTLGVKYGMPIGDNSELSMRAEIISQTVTDDNVPAGEETPDLDAVIVQVNYSFVW
ncbi:MAG: DUF3570 domain-containing protein [Gammaproteobacteria bacterium]|jgi:hypothetical protein|nr:DUF3570 domain-containing protein [Gammaproteobacteria bacterium]MBT3724718.1 DUF3570 domain-containing protein [Gammaproteobacteria bacterium]MBT4192823.1 DUF3570 domain-containing protein [Gammaproteobacteria bacterium]MBT4448744.1 DUF3570 domain-containing protein [Gammaproteobacteria bacterium]MBT4860596.1 DUF3570 domain-containing protein [Gammaproteobacteria bacterium]